VTLLHKIGGAAVAATLAGGMLATTILAQQPNRDPYDRYDRDGRWDDHSRLATIDPGTYVTVRVREPIDTERGGATVYPATVESDVWDNYRRLAIPMIQRGSPAELLVKTARDGDLILDLNAVTVGGERYAVDASRQRVDAGPVGTSSNTPAYVGGGAVIGSIIGAIAGGGKGAAVGAIAGAAGGAALSTQGRRIAVPPDSVLTFRLDAPLSVGVRDARGGR
jgi:hypothetical protein